MNKYIFLAIFLFFNNIFAKETKLIQSQPQILFEYKNLTKSQNELALQVKFNNAVLYLQRGEYQKAIRILKKTAKILKIPSFLNIGIAYYKLGSENNAYLYLKKIYDLKEAASEDTYSYMSSAYYLYLITNDKKFIEDIIRIASRKKRLSEHVKRLVVDTFILLKQYKKALKILESMEYPLDLKMALLYIKTKNFVSAKVYLEKALQVTTNDDLINKILWFKIYRDLKANDLENLQESLGEVQKRIKIYYTNKQMPLKIYFSRYRYSAKEYFDMVTKFNKDRKIDFIFYFAPFIFVDNDEVKLNAGKAFILKDKSNIDELDMMIDYNAKFIKLIKLDPILRAQELQKMIDEKYDTKSYEYYNLGLCYAQIDDFHKAHKYFKKAYNLNKGNKLFASFTILSANRIKIKIYKKEKEFIVKNILSSKGTYSYFGKYAYKIGTGESPGTLDSSKLTESMKKSIFFRGLYFLDNINKKGIMIDEPLLVEFNKDPLVYLLTLIARQNDENDYTYISRIQDNIPVTYNNQFLKGPLLITQYYIDILKAMGMFHKADLNIDGETSATYYRTKALVQLYNYNPESAISILEYLQKKYNLEDKYTFYLLIAAMLEAKKEQNASVTLALTKALLKDSDADFLTGVQLIQDLKLTSAGQYFRYKYSGDLIDFKIVGFDKFLEEL